MPTLRRQPHSEWPPKRNFFSIALLFFSIRRLGCCKIFFVDILSIFKIDIFYLYLIKNNQLPIFRRSSRFSGWRNSRAEGQLLLAKSGNRNSKTLWAERLAFSKGITANCTRISAGPNSFSIVAKMDFG